LDATPRAVAHGGIDPLTGQDCRGREGNRPHASAEEVHELP
jgi:hypothetical protein